MTSFNSAVVGPAQPGFEVANDPMHPRQDFGSSRGLTLNSWAMLVPQRIQTFVPVPVVRVDLTTRGNVFTNERVEGHLGSVWGDRQPNSTSMVPAVFHRNHNQEFTGAPSELASTGATDVSLVDFDYPTEGLPKGIDHGSAQPPAQGKGRPVRSKTNLALQLQSRDSRSQGAHEMGCPEPVPQRKSGPVHGGASCDRDFGMASMTVKEPPPNGPSLPASTAGTLEPVWPANAHQILDASLVRGESLLKFRERSRECGIVGRHANRLLGRFIGVKCISTSLDSL